MTDLRNGEVACMARSNHQASGSDIKLPRLAGRNFSSLVLEAINQALTDLLGRRARESIYDYLARERLVSKSDIPAHLDDLTSLFAKTFGKGGKTIEKSIVRNLHTRLGWEFVEISCCSLADYISMANDRFERAFPDHTRHSYQ